MVTSYPCKNIGYSKSAVRLIENGERYGRITTLASIAQAFDMSLSELLENTKWEYL